MFKGGLLSLILGLTCLSIQICMRASKKNLQEIDEDKKQSGEIDVNKYTIIDEEDEFNMDTGYGYYIDFK
jgi:hypothetical protein